MDNENKNLDDEIVIYKKSFWDISIVRLFFYGICLLLSFGSLFSCSISEEMKRIDASNKDEERQEASRSTNLTGEQIFMRSCYTCHSGTRDSYGPSLLEISQKYPEDAQLEAIIRKGKGIMPGQPANVINDEELNRLLVYLRNLKK